MIEIKISDNQVTLEGHAGYAEHGRDIVCAIWRHIEGWSCDPIVT